MPNDPYHKFLDFEHFKKKVEKTEIFARHPNSVLSEEMHNAYRHRFETDALQERARILAEYCAAEGYTRESISRVSLMDVARRKKIKFFFSYPALKEKLMTKTIAIFNKR